MTVVGFDNKVCFRITESDREKIVNIIRVNPEVFQSGSHFVRVALLRFLKDFDVNGKRLRL